jgi:Gram-negative bacterial TonB protein C-terminal
MTLSNCPISKAGKTLKEIVHSTKRLVSPASDESAAAFAQRLEAWAASLQHVEPVPPMAATAGTSKPAQARPWPELSEGRHRRQPWGWYATTFAVTAGLVFAASGFFRKALPVGELGLRAETKGESVLLSWNGLNRIVRSANGGTLEIDDGTQHREVHLDAAQISDGSILYRPASDDVTFRIAFRAEGGETVRQSVRVLDGLRGQLAGISAAKPAADLAAASKPASTSVKGLPRVPLKAPPVETPAGPVALSQDKSPHAPDTTSQSGASKSHAALDISPPPSLPDAGTVPEPLLNAPLPKLVDRVEPESKSPDLSPPAIGSNRAQTGPAQARPPESVAFSYSPPQPLRQVKPNPKPWIIASTLEIEVEVQVDKSGHVEIARLVRQDGKAPAGLVGAALAAARQWTFKPAKLQGKTVESTDRIVFRFRPANP